jgi:hypothetical protein
MPYRNSPTVPRVAETPHRRRSANDRKKVSLSTVHMSPEFSEDDDEDTDEDDLDVPRLRFDLAKQSQLRQPTTPSRTRPELPREPVSDPGRLRIDPEAFYSRVKPYQQEGRLPCGHKLYAYPAGKWSQSHKESCVPCYIQEGVDGRLFENDTGQPQGRASRSPTSRTSIAGEGPRTFSDNDKHKAHVERKPVAAKQNRDQIAPMVHHRLIQAAKKRLTDDEQKGYMYILRSTEKPGLLKLGCSKRDISERGKEHTCVGDLTWVALGNQVTHMKRAEKLAKRDLDHLRRDWWCPKCSKTHEEWFEVDEERAMEVMRRWTKWINEQAPYGKDGKLKPIWVWLMDVRRAPRVLFGQDDHQARWTKWKHVLSRPSSKTEIAWAKYSNQADLDAPTQQQDRKEIALPHRR